jgi:hypothetical protein
MQTTEGQSHEAALFSLDYIIQFLSSNVLPPLI